jgi:hypothetical protein
MLYRLCDGLRPQRKRKSRAKGLTRHSLKMSLRTSMALPPDFLSIAMSDEPPAADCKTSTASARPATPGWSATSVTSIGSPAAPTSPRGTARRPLTSSGDQSRHRLSRAGTQRVNRVLQIMAGPAVRGLLRRSGTSAHRRRRRHAITLGDQCRLATAHARRQMRKGRGLGGNTPLSSAATSS